MSLLFSKLVCKERSRSSSSLDSFSADTALAALESRLNMKFPQGVGVASGEINLVWWKRMHVACLHIGERVPMIGQHMYMWLMLQELGH